MSIKIKGGGDPLGRDQPKPEKNKPRKGAARSQKRPDKPEAAAPAVVRKTPTAAPSIKKGPGRPPGPVRTALLIKVPPEMVGRLDRTRLKLKLETRNDTVVALLDKGAVE